ncbi:Gfo/Idh/MocA family oxidoreductase [Membranicola marinus]|uniref:Gfo/Idh/MocA family oxidoreductase n=1 Tax=Membranihabitans marinus TaxID=1227546 RepID=A0A953HS45_9BACT|nr:Gfo/Idh/MocA family oxidoreductase [Membranihabitans marinus]
MHFNINRRHFLKNSSATLALATMGDYGLDLFHREKNWRVGLIGCGWYGKSDLARLMQVAPVEVVALCDVDQHHLAEAVELVNSRIQPSKLPQTYRDYRNMLANHEFDLVLIGTPDHWHALTMIDAVKAGAHVYVQKPTGVDVIESESMLAAARKYNRIVQVGTQRRSTPHLIEAKEKVVDAGLLGKVAYVEMFCYYHMRANGNPSVTPVPDFLDYDLWTGPAPLRPYDKLPHRGWWRTFMEYSNGIIGDMGVHMFDTVRWMLNLDWPERIYSTGGILVQKDGKSNTPDTQTATFEYPNLKCVWNHRSWGNSVDAEYPWGFKIYGEKGTLAGSVHKYNFTPRGEGKVVHGDVLYEKEEFPEDVTESHNELHVAPATRRHMLNFIAAVDAGRKPVADIREGHISSASCILGNLSMELGRALEYDAGQRVVKDDAEATGLLRRKYRGAWIHP